MAAEGAAPADDGAERNVAALHQYLGSVLGDINVDPREKAELVGRLFTTDYVDTFSRSSLDRGPDYVLRRVADLRCAFTEYRVEIDDLIATDDRVVVRSATYATTVCGPVTVPLPGAYGQLVSAGATTLEGYQSDVVGPAAPAAPAATLEAPLGTNGRELSWIAITVFRFEGGRIAEAWELRAYDAIWPDFDVRRSRTARR